MSHYWSLSAAWLVFACGTAFADPESPESPISAPPSPNPSSAALDGDPLGPDGETLERAPVLPSETPSGRLPTEGAIPESHHPFHEPLPSNVLRPGSVAVYSAQLPAWKCRQELIKRKLPFARDPRPTPGVATAVRLQGPIRGVQFLAPGNKSPYGALDCRLALALDALAEVLVDHGVKLARVDNFWRPGARLPGSKKKSQHNYGLAIDLMGLQLNDGRELDVEDHFLGVIGAPACGGGAVMTAPDERAIVLRNLICDLARRGIFHVLLTPNFNEAHKNHFHLDIKRDSPAWIIR